MKGNKDNGEVEVEFSDHVLLSNPDLSTNFHNSSTVDSFLEEFLKNTRTCTHTHTCNPHAAVHTHTCYHTHTQLIGSEEEEEDDHHRSDSKEHSNLKPRRRSSGNNREAVRKYREKKKAHTAYLEEEVEKLRLLNQQLVRKLQGQSILEAEVMRLRSVLVDLKGKIDNELEIFPFQKEGHCVARSTGIGIQCQTDLPCFHPQNGVDGIEKVLGAPWEGNCQPAIVDCQAKTHDMVTSAEEHS